MEDNLNISAQVDQLSALASKIQDWAKVALWKAAQIVRDKVVDLTPRYSGQLQGSISIRELDGGTAQEVFADGVVAHVMEGRPPAQWTKLPPFQPLRAWVEGKLGLSGKEADSRAARIRWSIFRYGIRVPLKGDGRGMMFKRSYDYMMATHFHWFAFVAAMRRQAVIGGFSYDA